jgi:hypothetical protein
MISDEQWALADEISADLRIYIDMILRMEREGALPDPFTEWLAIWAGLLGVLAWEHYTSVVVLLRAGKTRGAHSLSRTLFDYYVRLCYYRNQASPIIDKWRKKPRKKNLNNLLKSMHAYKDWFSVHAKMARDLRLTNPDLSDLDPESLKLLHEALKTFEKEKTGLREFRYMLKSVWPDEKAKQDMTYALWLRKSAYLHGDSLTRTEVMSETHIDGQAKYEALYESSILPVHVLKVATGHVLELMYQAYLITDRHYALRVLGPKALALFGLPDSSD